MDESCSIISNGLGNGSVVFYSFICTNMQHDTNAFDHISCDKVKTFFQSGNVGIIVNDQVGP